MIRSLLVIFAALCIGGLYALATQGAADHLLRALAVEERE